MPVLHSGIVTLNTYNDPTNCIGIFFSGCLVSELVVKDEMFSFKI